MKPEIPDSKARKPHSFRSWDVWVRWRRVCQIASTISLSLCLALSLCRSLSLALSLSPPIALSICMFHCEPRSFRILGACRCLLCLTRMRWRTVCHIASSSVSLSLSVSLPPSLSLFLRRVCHIALISWSPSLLLSSFLSLPSSISLPLSLFAECATLR